MTAKTIPQLSYGGAVNPLSLFPLAPLASGTSEVDPSLNTYDDAVAVFAKDIAAAAGPGGGSWNWTWLWNGSSTATHAFACSGNLVSPQRDVVINQVAMGLTTVTGGVYTIGIAPYDTVNNKITADPVYSLPFTETTGIANAWIAGKFATGVPLTGGDNHIIFVVRTDSGNTPSTTLQTVSALADGTIPGFIISGLSSANKSVHLASTAPTTSDVWTTETGWYLINFSFVF